MTIAPYAKLRVSLDGGAVQTGGVTANASQVVQLSADPAGLAGVTQLKYVLYAYPNGFTVPAGWSTDSTTGSYYYSTSTPGIAPPSFALGNSSLWGKYLFQLIANNAISFDPNIPAQQLVDRATGISVASPKGQVDIAAGETIQFGGSRAWVAAYQQNARVLEQYLGTASTVTVATIVTNNVSNLAAWSVVNDGYTAVQNDLVALAGQSTSSQNQIYTVGVVSGGVAALTALAQQPPANSIIRVINGTLFGNTLWAVESPGFQIQRAPDDVIPGANGTRFELCRDAVGNTKELVRDDDKQPTVTIAGNANADIYTFDCVGEGFTSTTGSWHAIVILEFCWADGERGAVTHEAIGKTGSTPTVEAYNGPTALGTDTHTTRAWSASGSTVKLNVTNNRTGVNVVVNAIAAVRAFTP